LPITFPNKDNEISFATEQWPGVLGVNGTSDCTFKKHCEDPTFNMCAVQPQEQTCQFSNYTEALQMGYRWYHARSITPAYPFGHGLTYTSFHYDQLEVAPISLLVSFTVTNSGSHPAAEVAQLYLTYPPSAGTGEPPKQLKAFEKTPVLSPGESTTVVVQLTDRDFSTWSSDVHGWVGVKGGFVLDVGASSADTRIHTMVTR
jgi:beta-glucosidase